MTKSLLKQLSDNCSATSGGAVNLKIQKRLRDCSRSRFCIFCLGISILLNVYDGLVVLSLKPRHNKLMKKSFLALGILALSAANYSSAQTSAPSDFAFKLYAKVAASGGNILVSPYGVQSVFSGLYPAAKNATKSQLESLGLANFQTISGSVQPVEFVSASRVWIQKDYPIKKDFLKASEKVLPGGVESAPLLDDMAASAKAINDWTSERTHKKIPAVVAEEQVEEMILTNAVAFRGDWQTAFDKKLTKTEEFTPAFGKKLKTPVMHHPNLTVPYFAGENFQIVKLPYAGGTYSMWVFLPKEAKGLTALEKSLTAANFETWNSQMSAQGVAISLPKFRARSAPNLISALTNMGVKSPFVKDADFSGLTGSKELHVSFLLQRVAVDVDERGAEAAPVEAVAATPEMAAADPAKADPSKAALPQSTIFKADHSFIYMIWHEGTKNPVLMGRLINP